MIKNLTNYIDFYVPIIVNEMGNELTIKYHTFPFGKVVLQNLNIYASSEDYNNNKLKCFITSLELPVLWEKGTGLQENSYKGSSSINIKDISISVTYTYRYLDKTLSIDITVTNSAA